MTKLAGAPFRTIYAAIAGEVIVLSTVGPSRILSAPYSAQAIGDAILKALSTGHLTEAPMSSPHNNTVDSTAVRIMEDDGLIIFTAHNHDGQFVIYSTKVGNGPERITEALFAILRDHSIEHMTFVPGTKSSQPQIARYI